jgi:hypothetical protein
MVARASTASSHPYLEQRCRFRLSARLLAPGRPAELLSILLHDRGRRFEADADPATLVDKGALGGNSSDGILGGQYRRHFAGHSGRYVCKQSNSWC